MAILPDCRGLEVTVRSNGQDLLEYPDEDREFNHTNLFSPPYHRRCLAYVECTSDAEFGIKCTVTKDYKPDVPHTHLRFAVYVDGKDLARGVKEIHKSDPTSFTIRTTQTRINSDEVVERKLVFKTIEKVDDRDSARVEEDIKLANGLGEILVVVFRCNMVEKPEAVTSTRSIPALARPSTTEISEKALKGKAISHGIGFGQETRKRKTKSASRYDINYIDGRKYPLAIFRFKYRSREALKQELIIPRSPSPDDLVTESFNSSQSGAISSSREERLAQLEGNSNQEMVEIKAEVKTEGQPPRKGGLDASGAQNSERANKPRRNRSGAVELIDLTEDD